MSIIDKLLGRSGKSQVSKDEIQRRIDSASTKLDLEERLQGVPDQRVFPPRNKVHQKYRTPPKVEKTPTQILMDAVNKKPKDADLRFDLAVSLLSKDRYYSSLTKPESKVWEKILTPSYFRNMAQTIEELNIALALGLLDDLKAAKASFLLIELTLSNAKIPPNKESLKNYPQLKDLADTVITRTKNRLRRNKYDIEALTLQISAYELVGNQKGVGKSQQMLIQARSLKKSGLLDSPTETSGSDNKKTWKNDGIDFEREIQNLLQAMGLTANMTTASADGGIDIEAFSDDPIFGGKYIIQCKDWKKSVGEPIVRDLYGVVVSEACIKGILVTSGRFTRSAEQFAEGKQIELIDGAKLSDLINQIKKT